MPSLLAKLVFCKECNFCGNECPHPCLLEMIFATMNAKTQRRSLLPRLLVVVIVVIAAVLIWRHFNTAVPASDTASAAPHAGGGKAAAGGRRGAPMSPVQAATATEQTVPRYLSGLGTATAANTVTVTSRVDGQLMAVHFTEGQQVKAGDLLVEIDPRPFEVQLTQALGQLAKNQATLANARGIWRATSNWRKPTWFHVRIRIPSSRWYNKPKARSKPIRARSTAPNCKSPTAASPRRLTAASA